MGDGASLEVGLTRGESKPKGNPSYSQWGGHCWKVLNEGRTEVDRPIF